MSTEKQELHLAYIERISAAHQALRAAQTELRAAVESAHAAGHTWDVIATALSDTASPANETFDDIPSIDAVVQKVLGIDDAAGPPGGEQASVAGLQ
ncbi:MULTISPECIES: hypothetical protein [Mycobacteriaceae]|jgi:hypothetical protein|uniref:Uncharacterized protein n=1 Tax=Mycolicibacterium mucogenicum TaxID=56689 RepID=A0A1A0MW32_MYCMU|nr:MULTISPECIES: hypothetical protein [Mycolicibacterium]OBA88988.1 hypothetical protein A5642_15750 [Mycolicibacterium mucogenicum]TDK90097.1 hypothetical protein EUA03_11075 [Mycolicibacterium mucogenicum]TXH15911.1 MAG: hypothetical protein E6R06_31985 [Mycobacterium sp.]GCA99891.1 hypothetical protein NCCNTM_35260 [Mycolicibacterium sp. NCC-Tsukiji]